VSVGANTCGAGPQYNEAETPMRLTEGAGNKLFREWLLGATR
jgi:hypothetical protein